MSDNIPPVPARLFLIMARFAPTAVILRRGPSKWVQLIKWNTQDDTFEMGQWFKGRIYERRCDLSPDGRYFLYFASKFNKKTVSDSQGYTYAWTAVSKPPYLTALALWPKGDCWHGGGMFIDNNSIQLNHQPEKAIPHPNHQPPRTWKIHPTPNASGEDEPIHFQQLTHFYGWQEEQSLQADFNRKQGFTTKKPQLLVKLNRKYKSHLVRQFTINGDESTESYFLQHTKTNALIPLPETDCARWDQRGRLVFVQNGRLYTGKPQEDGTLWSKEIANFNDHQPETIDSPSWAKAW